MQKVGMLKTVEIWAFGLPGCEKISFLLVFKLPRPPSDRSKPATLSFGVARGRPKCSLGSPGDPPSSPLDPPGAAQKLPVDPQGTCSRFSCRTGRS